MMSFKEFKSSVSTTNVSGPPQQPTTSKYLTDITKETSTILSPTPSTSSTMSSTVQDPSNIKMGKLFGFIDDAYRDIRRLHSGLNKANYNNLLMQIINKYKNGCNKIFEDVLESHEMSKKLAQNIVRTIDIFKELCTPLTDLEEYQHRVCEMMAIFIACELRLSVDTTTQEQLLIGQRIVYIMRRHLLQEVEEDTRYNILRTLVYIPRLFNARDIMCAIFGQFIPLKPVSDVNVLSDKIYMLYIIVFYRWMMMQKDDDDKLLIVNFAESFMKPSVTLCTNQLYAKHLPRYTTHSTATRTILNNMKFYRDIRNASIIDNALKKIGPIVDLCDDDEDADLIILDNSNSTAFAEIFSSVHLERLENSVSHIKLEEKTIIGTVDLTVEEEEESTYSPETIRDRHDKWLNSFQQLAKQYRESQIIIERQQNSQQISNNQKEVIISLDSDSENEEEDISTAASNVEPSLSTAKENNEKSNKSGEELFVDNYPPTVTPINFGIDLESSDVEDDDDATKLSSRFLSGTIRTYQVKKVNQVESRNSNDKAYRRDSIHISSTPPENPDEDEGTDVQDEHDQDEDESNLLSSITLDKTRPRGPYPTYDKIQSNKVVFSQSLTRFSYDKEHQAYRLQEREHNHRQTQQYYSDGSEIKTNKKQKKRVHFNTSSIGPTDVASSAQNKPLKPVLQQSTYKASYAPDYFHLRGFERFATTAPSLTGSTSTCGSASTTSLNKQDHQEHTIENCNNKNNEDKYREFKSIKINHKKNCLKNLSVFNQKYLFKHKSVKNVKINLKKLKLNSDISLTNSYSNFSKEEEVEPPPPLPHTSLTLRSDNATYINYKQTETCKLKTNSTDNPSNNNVQVNDDDILFKKPLPVTKKNVKSPKPFKIHKVVSLRAQPFYFKTIKPNQTEKGSSAESNEHVLKTPIVTNIQEFHGEIKAEPAPGKQFNFDNRSDLCNVPTSKEAEIDNLSKISKFLTEEINNLTSGDNNINTNTVNRNNDIENITQEKEINELTKENDIEITDKTEKEKETSENSAIISVNENIRSEKSNSLNEEKFNEINFEPGLSLNITEQASLDYIKNPLKEIEINEHINDKKEGEKEMISDAKCYQENFEKNTDNREKRAEDSEEIFENKLLEISNENTLIDNDVGEELERTYNNSKNTKDGKISSTSDQAITDFSKNENVKDDDILNTENKTDSSHNLVTQFCAEFLAGLPNEPSSELSNINNTECDARTDIDFEFENHCPTPTMCRFDLDTMSENTSDIPNTMPLTKLSSEECEADKLLEDFNHKTEDIVDSSLSKTSKTFDSIISNNDPVSHETIKRSREEEGIIEDENMEKKYISELLNDVSENNEENTEKNQNKSLTLIENIDISSKTEYAIIKETTNCSNIANKCLQESGEYQNNMVIVETDCNQTKSLLPKKETNKVSKDENAATTDKLLEENQTKVILSPNISTTYNNNDSLNKKEIQIITDTKERLFKKCSKSQKTKHNQEDYHETPLKKIKKFNKHANEGKVQSPIRENSEDIMKSKSDDIMNSDICTKPTEKLEDNKNPDKISKQIEKSINENQHMTLELANWKQDMQNESKPNNTESAGGVSAIFSFPKIPIISISICTTPNNKTYFKISNRENDDTPSKEADKMKTNNENINETKNDDTKMKTASEDSSRKDTNITNLDADEERKIEENKVIGKNNTEEEDEDYEEEGEEEEIDNVEIEKFSHDSNSACSLPLKKRPTQSEPNEETEDSEQILVTNLEQPQEIAAEVVIENFEKVKQTNEDISSSEIEQIMLEKEDTDNENNAERVKQQTTAEKHIDNSIMPNDSEDNKPSTSAASLKKLNDPSSPFKRRGNKSIRPIGQPPVQIVAPQLKDNSPSPSQEHRAPEVQVPNAQRTLTQNAQPLPESYPATPMLSVANVEKLMDFNRFIEDLLASPDVMTIIDNANACGYYAEGQAYEMERIAILEHYNIANAKGNTSVTKPLYWKKSAGDTISIFNDNDNEWIALPPSTAKQLLKLSFVLSILQQQYKVSDVRQRINIALTFLIQTSYTSKFKPNANNANTSSLQTRMQVYSRKISDGNNSSSHNMPQPLPSTSYFRIATNNDALNTNFGINSNIDAPQELQATNYTNTHQHEESEDAAMQQELTTVSNSSQNWNNLIQFGNTNSGNGLEHIATTTNTVHHIATNIENDQHQQHVQQEKRNSSWDELNNDQLYINPPCATSPQNEVIVNTNGVQLHEMPQNCQDQQNIFISITDESGPTVGSNPTEPTHKYNTRQQQQHRALDDLGQSTASSSSSPSSQSYGNRKFLGNGSGASSLIQKNLVNNNRNNIITIFGNQEINLQNPYRMQQNIQQQQQQPQPPQIQTNQLLNVISPNTSNQQQGNISSHNMSQNLSININNNNNTRPLNLLQQQQTPQQRMSTRYTASNFNSQQQQQQTISQNNQNKMNESNYKDILQPYITYLIKDHEKTSKHLLQVFEEVSNSNSSSSSSSNINANNVNNFTVQEQQFNNMLPALIRNPQQNHMPGFHQIPGERNINSILPSLIRNPNHTLNITDRDSGALQVVQSFLDQSQPNNNSNKQLEQQQQQQHSPETSSTFINPGFAKEYVNFIGSRDEVLQKQKLRNFHRATQQIQQHHEQLQQHQRQEQFIQETERLNSVKRKCQERHDKLAEDLKCKIMEFSQLKHNVQIKLSEKQQQEQRNIAGGIMQRKRRGRPKKSLVSSTISNAISTVDSQSNCNDELSLSIKDKPQRPTKTSNRTKRKQVNSEPPSSFTTTDHAYSRQRTAAREAAKRINAAVNNSFQ